jgi:hypothetical protein
MADEISGAVGYTLLKHPDIEESILLFSDIHADVTYCENPNSREIHTLLDQFTKKGITVFLEEALREINIQLEPLWSTAYHTEALRLLNLTNHKIRPIDIRPLLIPFSWELCQSRNNQNCLMTLREYLEEIEKFFKFESISCIIKYILPEIRQSLGYARTREILVIHFYLLKEIFEKYLYANQQYWDYTIKQLLDENKTDILEKVNMILSMIMEWYIILLINNCQSHMIIHIGLAHSTNVLELLTSIYKYKVTKQTGINKMTDLQNVTTPQVSACIRVPDKYHGLELFKKKYHFN